MIHGISERSGTSYVGHLLGLHPTLRTYPRDLRELPFMAVSRDILDIQKKFIALHKANAGKMQNGDFLRLFGASFLAYLHSGIPENCRILTKAPMLNCLELFQATFPGESLLLLLRDGRDVVESSIQTWPRRDFVLETIFWRNAAVLAKWYLDTFDTYEWFHSARYEDILRDPEEFVTETCTAFGLQRSVFPQHEIDALPVIGSSHLKRGTNATWDPVRKPKGFETTRRWREWPNWKKRVFKKHAGRALIDLGYESDENW